MDIRECGDLFRIVAIRRGEKQNDAVEICVRVSEDPNLLVLGVVKVILRSSLQVNWVECTSSSPATTSIHNIKLSKKNSDYPPEVKQKYPNLQTLAPGSKRARLGT